tara:strand:- start:80 stop:340 length:261 start_codon:yes stop_codon:yes gene_type:complete
MAQFQFRASDRINPKQNPHPNLSISLSTLRGMPSLLSPPICHSVWKEVPEAPADVGLMSGLEDSPEENPSIPLAFGLDHIPDEADE